MFQDATPDEINSVMKRAREAFYVYRKLSLKKRNTFMHQVAENLENSGNELIQAAMEETHLPEARLHKERARTVLQLRQYGDACAEGDWLQARINTSGKKDLRKTQVPLGPVIVFGSSNFPFAYSTAGGDTACAFAAGCPVVVKAHPSHPKTSGMVADLISKAVKECDLPDGVFGHVYGAASAVGKQLVEHPFTAAVGFTGSLGGGRQLYDWACRRPIPIPVFSEMGSVNPTFLLPEKLQQDMEAIVTMYATAIVQGVGQYCTNPGLLIGIAGNEFDQFTRQLGEAIRKVAPQKMLHKGIAASYDEKRKDALEQKGVSIISSSEVANEIQEGSPTLAQTTASQFISNPVLHQEVFGPYSLLITCNDAHEMLRVAQALEGQLTATIIGTENEIKEQPALVERLQDLCGRYIINDVSNGVEVCLAMQHGGPYPATTDSRFTAVGADGIRRFTRPIAYQDWPDSLLPDELKNDNPLNILRTVDGNLTRESINQ